MLETIERFKISSNHQTRIDIPHDATFIKAAFFHDGIYVWYRFSPKRSTTEAWIAVLLDGEPIPKDWKYLETIVMHGAYVVYHIFEVH